ncbi:MAG: hypothetical protein OQL16_11960 [Gammaproteobacteria bacterium]|nr:hypothetical protein [Gammaproteobacteria bacterium]
MNSLVATSGFAVLGFVFPPLLVMSLASLGLVTMRRGSREGLLILLGCIALLGSMTLLSAQPIRLDLIVLTFFWLTAWIIAMVYRLMSTPAWMINAAGVIGLGCVAAFYLLVSDPGAFWLVLLDQYLRPLFVEQQLLQSSADLDKLMMTLAQVLTGGLAAMVCVVLITGMLLARWWQALLYNPGGFRQEFYALRLGHVTALVMMALLAVSLFGQHALSTDMVTVLWLLFFFQGLAVVHSLIGMTGMGVGWLVSLYLLLAIVPNYASPVISGLGLVDTWFDFRRRVPRKNKPDISE